MVTGQYQILFTVANIQSALPAASILLSFFSLDISPCGTKSLWTIYFDNILIRPIHNYTKYKALSAIKAIPKALLKRSFNLRANNFSGFYSFSTFVCSVCYVICEIFVLWMKCWTKFPDRCTCSQPQQTPISLSCRSTTTRRNETHTKKLKTFGSSFKRLLSSKFLLAKSNCIKYKWLSDNKM